MLGLGLLNRNWFSCSVGPLKVVFSRMFVQFHVVFTPFSFLQEPSSDTHGCSAGRLRCQAPHAPHLRQRAADDCRACLFSALSGLFAAMFYDVNSQAFASFLRTSGNSKCVGSLLAAAPCGIPCFMSMILSTAVLERPRPIAPLQNLCA